MTDTSFRGNAAQFFVAGELCRCGYAAVVTLGNTPNTDVLCSNPEGTKFIHIQVKTFAPGNNTCTVGMKAEKDFGPNFFWILAGVPKDGQQAEFEYFIIPSKEMAQNVTKAHAAWLKAPGKGGKPHLDSKVRVVALPPKSDFCGWSIESYRGRWDLIAKQLNAG